MKFSKYFLSILFSGIMMFGQQKDVLDQMSERGEVQKMYRYLVAKKKKQELNDKEFSHLIFAAQMTGNVKNAIAFATEWENAAAKKKDSSNLIKALNYKAKIYHQNGQIKESAKLADFLIKYYRRKNVPEKVKQNQLVLGLSLSELKQTARAKAVYDSIDKSNFNIQDSLSYFVNYSNIQADLKNYSSALEMAKIGVKVLKQSGETSELPLIYSNIAIISNELRKPAEALKYLDSAKIYLSDFNNLWYRQMILENLYQSWSALGNTDSAFASLKKLREIDLLIAQKKTNEELESLKIAFHKEKELNSIVANSQKQIEKNKVRNLVLLILALLLALGAIWMYYFFRLKNIRAETKNTDLEMKLLRSQINPHFIFNTLASIQSLIRQGKNEESITYLNSFARFSRTVLDSSRKSNVTLETELDLVKKYAELQQLRKNNFDFEIHNSDEIEEIKDEIMFPAMSLQPFVENSILHGFKNIDYRGKVIISSKIKENRLHIVIDDNGSGIKEILNKADHQSHAISIMQERLRNLDREMKTKSFFEILNKTNEKGVLVKIEIPLLNFKEGKS